MTLFFLHNLYSLNLNFSITRCCCTWIWAKYIRTTFVLHFIIFLKNFHLINRENVPHSLNCSTLVSYELLTYAPTVCTWNLLTSLFRGKIIKGKDHWLFSRDQSFVFLFFICSKSAQYTHICTFRKVQKYASYYGELNKSRSTKSSMGKVHWKLFQKNQKDSSFHLKSCKRQVINK